MATMIHSYPEKCSDTIKGIEENKRINGGLTINKWYENSHGFIWMINGKGYYHIWKFDVIETNIGKFKGMVHYRLTDDNTLHEVGYKILETKEDAEQFYKSFDAE